MIRLGFSNGEVTLSHGATQPLVYLDHFALMEIAANHADRFVATLEAKNGTLALSWINFLELVEVSPSTLAPVKAILRRLFPDRAVFLDTNSLAVADREDKMLARARLGAPFLHEAWADLYFRVHRTKSLNPLEPSEFLEMFEQPDLQEKLDGIWEEGRSGIVAMFEDARAWRDVDAAVAKRIRALPPKADPAVPPTRWVMIEGLKYVLKNNLNLTSGNHLRDFLHMAVPISYCDLVVLDQNWREAARQIQNVLRGRGLLIYNDASVFSSVSDFLAALERWKPGSPP